MISLFFVRFDLATDVSYETATRQDFPSVTVCNLNPIQRGKIPEGGSLEKLLHKYESLDDTQDGPEFTDLNLKLLSNLKVRYAAKKAVPMALSDYISVSVCSMHFELQVCGQWARNCDKNSQ